MSAAEDGVSEAARPVHKSASDKDIRAAYKRLSKKWHPDKNKDPSAEGKFVEIARGVPGQSVLQNLLANQSCVAYEVLSDATVSQRLTWAIVHALIFR